MNTKEIVAELSSRLGLGESETGSLLKSVVDNVSKELLDSNSVAIQGFGAFEVRKKEERISVNPATKQRMLIPPKLSLAFKPSVTLKDRFKEIEK